MSLQRILDEKARAIATSAELMAEQTNDWQTIQAYVSKRVAAISLTEKQTQKLKRYEFAYNQLISGKYSEREVGEMVAETFGLEITQAMRDLRDARELFVTSFSINKVFEIKLQLELNAKYQRIALAKGDLRALTGFEKNAVALRAMLPDEEKALGEDFIPHVNEFVFDPSLLGIKPLDEKDLARLYKDLRSRFGKGGIPETEDADFEEINDGEEANPL